MKTTTILLSLLGLTLSGCGRVGAPVAPGPANQVVYPQAYPSE